jgi:MFS family permease
MRRRAPYIRLVSGAALLSTSLSLVIAGTAYFIVPVTTELSLSRSAFIFHYSLFTLLSLVSIPVLGRLAQRFGVRRLVLAGGVWTALGLAGMSVSTSLTMFYVFGAWIGLTLTSTLLFTPGLINAWFDKKRGVMLGITIGAGGLGGVGASAVLPPFIAMNGWQAGYLLLAGLSLVLVIVAGLMIRNKPQDLGLEPYGAGTAEEAAEEILTGVPYRTALKSPEFWMLFIGVALFMGVVAGQEHYPAYLADQGMGPGQIAGIMSLYFTIAMVVLPLVGFISDKLGLARTMTLVWITATAGWIVLLVAGQSHALQAVGVFLLLAPAANSILPALLSRSAFGLKDGIGILGAVIPAGTVGIALLAPLWGLAHDLTKSYTPAFLLSPLVLGAGFLLAVLAVRRANTKWPANSVTTNPGTAEATTQANR